MPFNINLTRKIKQLIESYEKREMELNVSRQYRNLRIRKIEKLIYTPVIPVFCKVLYYCMIILTAVAVILEVLNYIKSLSDLGFDHLRNNIITTIFMSWTFFASILLLTSFIQLIRLKRGYVEKKYVYDEKDGSGKTEPVADPERKYFRYSVVAAAGTVIFGCLYFIIL